MRVVISGDLADVLVIAEPFEIEGSHEQFAVHRTFGSDDAEERGAWSATHVETGLRVAAGGTIDEAIEVARTLWASKTPEQIAAVLNRGASIRQARAKMDREVLS
jgi:hypothetical protein